LPEHRTHPRLHSGDRRRGRDRADRRHRRSAFDRPVAIRLVFTLDTYEPQDGVVFITVDPERDTRRAIIVTTFF